MLLGLASHYFFGISIFLVSLFLILLILVQRGRGGGIAGALGGAGGQSAFGTKAGDLFTRITVGVAAFWILLCCAAILVLKDPAFTTGVSKRASNTGSVSGFGDAAQEAAAPIPPRSETASPESEPATSEAATSEPTSPDATNSDATNSETPSE